MYDDGMQCSGVQWNGSMECNAVEWNAMDAFWSFCVILTLLVILDPNLVVLRQKRKKVNFLTRRRQIHLTTKPFFFFRGKFLVDIFIHEISR